MNGVSISLPLPEKSRNKYHEGAIALVEHGGFDENQQLINPSLVKVSTHHSWEALKKQYRQQSPTPTSV